MDQDAEEAFKNALEVDPLGVYFYNRLGIALRKQGKYREAIGGYKKALEIDSDDQNVHYNLGRAYMEAAMISDAKKQFKEAVRINPDFKEAKTLLQSLKEMK
jgi:tetratricopeptide (TPR) repeat protein